jgi:hypothetical protein
VAGSVANSISAHGAGVTTLTTGAITSAASGNTFVVTNSSEAGRAQTPSDSKSNTYTILGTEQASGSGGGGGWWRKENGVGGASHTFTVTWNAASNPTILAAELAGVTTTSTDTGSAAQISDNASPFTVTSGTFAQADEIVLCHIQSDSGSNPATFAESTGFTIFVKDEDGSLYWASALGYKVISATTALTPSWTTTGAADCPLHICGFRASSAAALEESSWFPTEPRVAPLLLSVW